MREIKITESALKSKNLIYLQNTLVDIVEQINAKFKLINDKNRCEYLVSIPDGYFDVFSVELKDKLADVIAVNYKYCYFKRNLKITGLSSLDKEVLLTALIAADIDEDKKYIFKKLRLFSEYAIDGIFNFRMKPLKEKWKEIIGYVPNGFTDSQLKDFVGYLLKDKTGKRVYIEGSSVYDKRFNKLSRVSLLTSDSGKLKILKEILLSGAGEVELLNPIDDMEDSYLKEYYGDKVTFNSSFYSK